MKNSETVPNSPPHLENSQHSDSCRLGTPVIEEFPVEVSNRTETTRTVTFVPTRTLVKPLVMEMIFFITDIEEKTPHRYFIYAGMRNRQTRAYLSFENLLGPPSHPTIRTLDDGRINLNRSTAHFVCFQYDSPIDELIDRKKVVVNYFIDIPWFFHGVVRLTVCPQPNIQ